jgi:hypothetical protein
MTAPEQHECIDCIKLPEKPADVVLATGINWIRAGYRPKKPVAIVTPAGKPKRCKLHQYWFKKAQRERRSNTRTQRFSGLTEEQYWAIHAAQGGKCAFPLCRATGASKRLAVHHNHEFARENCIHDPIEEACPNCVDALLCGPHNYDLLGKFVRELEFAIALRDRLVRPAEPVLGAPLTSVVR